MAQTFRKHVGERKAALVAHFAANGAGALCDDCIRGMFNCTRSGFTEKDIRESALEAGLVRKIARCQNCEQQRFVIAAN
jgi:hypothetical protein